MMARLNRTASEAMVRAGAHAATDITGFGLLGHAFEMAEGSGVSFQLNANDIPVLDEAMPYLTDEFTCGGSRRNVEFGDGRIEISDSVSGQQRIALYDVQTSGGLLIALQTDGADALVAELRAGGDSYAARIGSVSAEGPVLRVE